LKVQTPTTTPAAAPADAKETLAAGPATQPVQEFLDMVILVQPDLTSSLLGRTSPATQPTTVPTQ